MITKQGKNALFLSFLILFALLFVLRVSNLNDFVSKVTFSTRIVC